MPRGPGAETQQRDLLAVTRQCQAGPSIQEPTPPGSHCYYLLCFRSVAPRRHEAGERFGLSDADFVQHAASFCVSLSSLPFHTSHDGRLWSLRGAAPRAARCLMADPRGRAEQSSVEEELRVELREWLCWEAELLPSFKAKFRRKGLRQSTGRWESSAVSPCPQCPQHPHVPTAHLAAVHPAAPSPTPAPATRAARTPGTASPHGAAPGRLKGLWAGAGAGKSLPMAAPLAPQEGRFRWW